MTEIYAKNYIYLAFALILTVFLLFTFCPR